MTPAERPFATHLAARTLGLMLALTPVSARGQDAAVLEDFSDIVTTADLGFDDFSGTMGEINGPGSKVDFTTSQVVCAFPAPCGLELHWDFGTLLSGFTGQYFSLKGPVSVATTVDRRTAIKVPYPEHALDLDAIDGTLMEPGGARRFVNACAELVYAGSLDLTLRLELQDVRGGTRYTRVVLQGSPDAQTRCWDFRDRAGYKILRRDLNLHRAKVLSLVIERRHIVDRLDNPVVGNLTIRRVFLTLDRPQAEPETADLLFDLLERRVFQYFLDWSSPKPASRGIPQDRTTFADLLTVGGVGFALPAYAIGAERGWITRGEAARRALEILRVMHDVAAFGPQPVGRIGHRGWFYHFLGHNGRRKLNLGQNTVELSTVDTALALLGALVAQSYFDGATPQETEIRRRAQEIYDRVDWPFLLDASTGQLFLGWKPRELREGKDFEIIDDTRQGAYSNREGPVIHGVALKWAFAPATWDVYTDEALIITLLAAGATRHPVPADVFCALGRERLSSGLVASWPGALFTYQFLHAFLDAEWLSTLPACPGETPVNWYENSRQAMNAAIDHAVTNPEGFPTYGPDAWGISAAEGPSDAYHGYGAPPIALVPSRGGSTEEDGTIAYYAMMNAAGFGDDLRSKAESALRLAWARGHWHPRFGIPDAFHDDVASVPLPERSRFAVRDNGPWANRALFAIDQGPMLLHLENARSRREAGRSWLHERLQNNRNIRAAYDAIEAIGSPGTCPVASPVARQLEGELGYGNGEPRPRSAATGKRTVWLPQAGHSRGFSILSRGCGPFRLAARYSNDNLNDLPSETVKITVNGDLACTFVAADTGDDGVGWNRFAQWPGPVDPPCVVQLRTGVNSIVVTIDDGDGYGLELDNLRFQPDR